MNTKQHILDTAEQAARTRGYDGFSYADLSKEVGIRKASIHHHFPTKADLGYALMARYREAFIASLQDLKGTAAQRLDGYLGIYRDALSGGSTLCLCVAFSAGRESLSPEVLAELKDFHTQSLAWLESVFQTAIQDGSVQNTGDPQDEANALLALVEGGQLMARAASKTDPFDQAISLFKHRLA